MEPVRIIPCLDVKDGRVVKGVHFVNLRDVKDPVEAAAEYEKEGADEIAFLDITATVEGRKTMVELAAKVKQQVRVPFIVGGGIKTTEDMDKLFQTGVDKVSINTAAVKNPPLIKDASAEYGQRVIVAIDAKGTENVNSGFEVVINGGRTLTGLDAVNWAKQVESLGATEILLTSMDADGTQDGYDLGLTRSVAEAVSIPVIASGGAGNLEHLYQAVTQGKAKAVLAASIFHFRQHTIREAKEYLQSKGIPVKL